MYIQTVSESLLMDTVNLEHPHHASQQASPIAVHFGESPTRTKFSSGSSVSKNVKITVCSVKPWIIQINTNILILMMQNNPISKINFSESRIYM